MKDIKSNGKALVLCADDYGYSVAVDQAIIDLVGRGRLTALSCLVQSPHWPESVGRLRDSGVAEQADVGLHINLTENLGAGVWCRPLPALIRSSYLNAVLPGRLPLNTIRDSLRRQFDAFGERFGGPPDHVDGHQHVHQLPQIRDLLLACLDEYDWHPWLRVTSPSISVAGVHGFRVDIKGHVIASLGGWTFGRRCRHSHRAHNVAFGGAYGFDADEARYLELLSAWLRHAPDGGLLMCHPAIPGETDVAHDPIAAARLREYRVLASSAVGDMLDAMAIRLVRGSQYYGGQSLSEHREGRVNPD